MNIRAKEYKNVMPNYTVDDWLNPPISIKIKTMTQQVAVYSLLKEHGYTSKNIWPAKRINVHRKPNKNGRTSDGCLALSYCSIDCDDCTADGCKNSNYTVVKAEDII